MTCRTEILNCVHEITKGTIAMTFTVEEVLDCMQRKGTKYPESTIRTHVTSRLCRNAPKNHAKCYDDFERIGHGLYRLIVKSTDTGAVSKMSVGNATKPIDTSNALSSPAKIAPSHGRDYLQSFGFKQAGYWYFDEGKLKSCLNDLPDSKHGLYAFVLNDQVLYIGKTSNSLKRRLYGYLRPGPTQFTNIRANNRLQETLRTNSKVDIYYWADETETRADELFLDKAAGYESALIKKLNPSWNVIK